MHSGASRAPGRTAILRLNDASASQSLLAAYRATQSPRPKSCFKMRLLVICLRYCSDDADGCYDSEDGEDYHSKCRLHSKTKCPVASVINDDRIGYITCIFEMFPPQPPSIPNPGSPPPIPRSPPSAPIMSPFPPMILPPSRPPPPPPTLPPRSPPPSSHNPTTTSTRHPHHQHSRNTLMMLPASPPRRCAHRLRCRCHAMLHINLTTHGHAGTTGTPLYTRFGQNTCAGSEIATCWGSILLVVTIQPTRAPRFAHMARAITIGCFVVRLVEPRPAVRHDGPTAVPNH